VVSLEEGEYALIRRDRVTIKDQTGKNLSRRPREIQWTPSMAEKGGFKHFMLKEIFEQPRAAADTMAGRVRADKGEVRFEDFALSPELLRSFRKVSIAACGTAWHAALIGKYLLEKFARIPVEVDIASEFRYRGPLVDRDTLLILVSQSGETADTLAALEEGKRLGATTLSICNVLDSSIPRRSDGVIYTRAGPEIGVASTKAFMAQLIVLYLFAVYFGGVRRVLARKDRVSLLTEALRLPGLIEKMLKDEKKIIETARRFYQAPGFFYTGRGINFPIALEGALKLKEISYIHAEGCPAGELKHGPIALVDEHVPVVVLATRNVLLDKVLSNLEEVAARGGNVIAFVNPGDIPRVKDRANSIIPVPLTNAQLTPILLVIPLQLLAYHIAELNGTDVDQPRNLAKSVTVE
jgi:glucosamine--fructose-6-phosphate aminotransferase (isomerizing)